MTQEKKIWEGSPSQWKNFMFYLGSSILIIAYGFGLILALWKYLETRCNHYKISTQRITEKKGILSTTTNQLELYRVKDIQLEQPFMLRIFGLCNIVLITSDQTHPRYILRGLEKGDRLMEQIRQSIDQCRTMRGVKELDFY